MGTGLVKTLNLVEKLIKGGNSSMKNKNEAVLETINKVR